ncbi:hypothetical protein O6H91_21G057500 [Diphasiastrum complanatum]|uniref:Uncharacterized protein n=1 Tax=Diphasiastrum complanatum TaxID=34168 RepID=A0ACC2AKR6_DIPCM|nr:hypothetical protein O6H91_21G057500 [Diphasiastrum complanatum]
MINVFPENKGLQDLPKALELNWWSGAGLKHILSQCRKAIDSFQDFWTVMEDIDRKAWVLEPVHPSRAISFRRIALGGHCSLSITVDALSPRTLPEYRFFGSENSVAPLRMRVINNLNRWKMDMLLLENLESVLELVIPSRQDIGNEDSSADCGICYAYFIPNAYVTGSDPCGEASRPDRVCENLNCGRTFHGACLVEWLRSLTTTRQSFDVLFGHCPYCSHPIAVKNSI